MNDLKKSYENHVDLIQLIKDYAWKKFVKYRGSSPKSIVKLEYLTIKDVDICVVSFF